MEQLNTQLFLWLNASGQSGPLQLWLTTFVAEWLIYGLPLLLVLLWVTGKRPARQAAVTATLSVLLALALGQLIGLLWPHPRPFMVGLGQTLLAHQPETSFPSDHATVFFTLGLSLLWSGWRKLAAWVLLIGTLVTGLSGRPFPAGYARSPAAGHPQLPHHASPAAIWPAGRETAG